MKLIIVVTCALVAVVAATSPPYEPPQPQIIRSDLKQEVDGSYTLNVQTSDGSHREETGQLQEVNNEEGKPVKVIIVRGSYGYRDTEGNPQDITYVADQDGFRAEGPSIPKNPEPSRR